MAIDGKQAHRPHVISWFALFTSNELLEQVQMPTNETRIENTDPSQMR